MPMPTQISDVVVPAEFSEYIAENSLVSTALFQSSVLVPNSLIESQLAVGSTNFSIPFWGDLGENDPDITSDNPAVLSTPLKLSAYSQIVRKSFLHQSWRSEEHTSELQSLRH